MCLATCMIIWLGRLFASAVLKKSGLVLNQILIHHPPKRTFMLYLNSASSIYLLLNIPATSSS